MHDFAGAGYYNQNNFDSASYFLLQAAEAPNDTGVPEDRIRLYNTLGVLYYDNGNYLQSKNYFTQALRIVEAIKPSDIRIAYSLQLNMATCFYKLGLYEQALSLYRKVMRYQLLSDPLVSEYGQGICRSASVWSSFVFFQKSEYFGRSRCVE